MLTTISEVPEGTERKKMLDKFLAMAYTSDEMSKFCKTLLAATEVKATAQFILHVKHGALGRTEVHSTL